MYWFIIWWIYIFIYICSTQMFPIFTEIITLTFPCNSLSNNEHDDLYSKKSDIFIWLQTPPRCCSPENITEKIRISGILSLMYFDIISISINIDQCIEPIMIIHSDLINIRPDLIAFRETKLNPYNRWVWRGAGKLSPRA